MKPPAMVICHLAVSKYLRLAGRRGHGGALADETKTKQGWAFDGAQPHREPELARTPDVDNLVAGVVRWRESTEGRISTGGGWERERFRGRAWHVFGCKCYRCYHMKAWKQERPWRCLESPGALIPWWPMAVRRNFSVLTFAE